MDRTRLTPLAVGLAALLILGGSIAAAATLPSLIAQTGKPAQAGNEEKQGPSAEKVQKILDRLGAAGIKTTADEFNALAQKYGVGGAVRVLAFADAAGTSTAAITAMRDAGKGWGEIRKELGLTIGPGLGWILGQGDDQAKKAKKGASGDDDPDD